MNKGKEFCRNIFTKILTTLLILSVPALAKSKTPLPAEVISAKTIYLVNKTGDQDVLDTAYDQIKSWGRFTIAKSKDDAELVAVFTHKYGMDKFGNTAFIEMDVFVKDHSEPAFMAKNAFKWVSAPQHRTKACIADFRKTLEPKN
jgi:hypothetical protein